jgi:hypothetical protein
MPDASDEQTWWSTLFVGGVDPALQMPDGTWQSAMTAALDVDTPEPADDLVPDDEDAIFLDAADEDAAIHHGVADQPASDDGVLNGAAHLDPDTERDLGAEYVDHDGSDPDSGYGTATDDLAYDFEDASEDETW